MNLLKARQYPLPQIERFAAPEMVFGTYDLDNPQPEALLFQTGYTIKGVEGRLYCGQSPAVALRQIRDKGYVGRYRDTGKRIWALGIMFDADERNVDAWQVEALD